ncbi:MAG: polyprenyl synthetase family protein [bacterium]|nr:polyprenyl synthetase family protein [bacterium]
MSSISNFFNYHIPIIDDTLSQYITFNFTDNRRILEDAIRYSVTAKAKRIRPLIAIATHQLFTDNAERIMPLGCAIEMVHAYSLIHDDLPAMDDDDVRRGQPTCHVKFGEDMAILAGDVLNTYAFEIVGKHLGSHYNAEQVVHVIIELAKAFGIQGMAGGQVLDLKSGTITPNETYLKTTHALKTGAILKACVTLPAYLEKASRIEQETLADFGDKMGLLFQIVDDILDVKGSSEELGKTPNKDADQNKLTYVTLWGLEKAEVMATELANSALSDLAKLTNRNTTRLEQIINFIHNREN